MRYSRRFVAPSGFGQVLPCLIWEFLGRASSTILRSSIHPRLGRDLGRVDAAYRDRKHRFGVHRTIRERYPAVSAHVRQGMLAPVDIVALREVLARMRAAALLARLGAVDGGYGVGHQIFQFQRL